MKATLNKKFIRNTITVSLTLMAFAYAFDFMAYFSDNAATNLKSAVSNTTYIDYQSVSGSTSLNTKKPNELRILFNRKYKQGFGIGEQEKALIEKFAKDQNYELTWLEINNSWELLPAMFELQGDVIVAQGYDIAGGLDSVVSFTEPWGVTKQQLVTRGEQKKLDSVSEIKNREIALKKSSAAWKTITTIMKNEPSIKVKTIEEDLTESEILNKVESGYYDIAVLDSDYLNSAIADFEGLNIIFDLPAAKLKAWSVHKKNVSLKQQLNDFLNKELLNIYNDEQMFSDFPDLKEKGHLRLISYQSSSNVYYQNGQLKGLEYELAKNFADKHGLELHVVLAKSYEELFGLLKQGKGDVISASIPESKSISSEFSKTDAYLYSSPTIISRKTSKRLIDLTDLNNRTIVLSHESPYLNLFENLKQKTGINFNIKLVDKQVNTETLLFMVSLGIYDLTVIPGHTAKSELSRQINLTAALKVSEPNKLVWVTRNEDTRLRDELNNFIKQEYRQTTFNSLKEKYIVKPTTVSGDSKLLTRVFELTPFDDVIIKHAEDHGFDWRLIAAQMYQESQFDPEAISSAGAEGLMQIMPRTAEELGLQNIKDPEKNIAAGVEYLSRLRERFKGDLLLTDKNWMALAAYNAGFSRIQKARNYAEQIGLDRDKWFGNVEVAMKKMAKLKSDSDKKICRCGQTVVYVRDIRTRYNNYIGITDSPQLASLSN